MTYQNAKETLYKLEAQLADLANKSEKQSVKVALGYAKSYLSNQVAEYIRTAEKAEQNGQH